MSHSLTMDINLKALEIKACILYFEDLFERRHIEAADAMRVLWTPFHSALTHGEHRFVSWLLEKCAHKYPGLPYFMLNIPVDYTLTEASRGAGYLSSISGNLKPDEQEVLLASHQSPLSWSVDIPAHLQDLCFELPLSLALAGGSHEILEKVVKEGADPFCTDSRGETILHHLVHLCVIAPQRALDAYKYVMYWLSTDYKVQLLAMKTKQGLKALDLAATLGVPEMMQLIINTDGVYRHVVGEYGLCKHILYDVTDYEGDQAKTHKSLLYYMTDMTEEQLQRAKKCQLLTKEPFHTWCQAKTQANKRGMILYVVAWAVFVMFYVIRLIMFFQAGTISINGIDFPLGTVAFLVLLLEGMHSKSNFREVKTAFSNIYDGRVPVTFTFAYRVIHLVFCCCLLLALMMSFLDCSYQAIVQSVYVFTAMCAVLSFLFFMQMMSGVGHLLIVTQKMLFDTLIFMLMLLLVYLGFALGLYLLHLDPTNKGCAVAEARNGTVEVAVTSDMFQTFGATLYETFLLMFTVMAPTDIYFQASPAPLLSIVLYMSMVVIVGIVELNILIAIMSQRTEEIHAFRDDILKLEKVSICLFLEQRGRNAVTAKIDRLGQKILGAQQSAFHRSGPKVFLQVLEAVLDDTRDVPQK